MTTGVLDSCGPAERDDVLQQWQGLIRSLANDVRSWSESQGWRVEERPTELTEEQLGSYDVPILIIQLRDRPVFLQPVARLVMGAAGRVDLYSYPSMDRVMLLHDGKQWMVRPELGPTWPLPWGRDTFIDLVERLSASS